jgi:transcriptional regulator with XRE-family HTH domain
MIDMENKSITRVNSEGMRLARVRTKGWSYGRISRETGLSIPQVSRIWRGLITPGHKSQLLIGRKFKIGKDLFYQEATETASEENP